MAFLNRLERLRDQFKCVVAIVHHTGHSDSKRARGASAMKGALDWKILVDGKNKKIESRKMKEGELFGKIPFKLEKVADSAVIIFGEISTESEPILNKPDQLAFEVLRTLLKQHEQGSVSEDVWRDGFCQNRQGTKESSRKAFQRAKKKLIHNGMVSQEGTSFGVSGQTRQNGTLS